MAIDLQIYIGYMEIIIEWLSHGNQQLGCNRTDQIIRAQVQKQAPKHSNF
jgi:hypothetical protein